MLTNDISPADLQAVKQQLRPFIPEEVQEYFVEDTEPVHIQFPVLKYPAKVQSLNLLKTPVYQGTLMGIKGQYLIFEDNTVFNVRSNEGLVVQISI